MLLTNNVINKEYEHSVIRLRILLHIIIILQLFAVFYQVIITIDHLGLLIVLFGKRARFIKHLYV